MKKMMFAAVAVMAVLGSVSLASAGDYSAIAIGVNGWGSADHYSTMEAARKEAIRQCRRYGGSCNVSVAEHSSWYFAAGYCNGVPYAAASPSEDRAVQGVSTKGSLDDNYDCEVVHMF